MENFSHLSVEQWFSLILGDNKLMFLDEIGKEQIIHFLGVQLEQLWLMRNLIWKKKFAPSVGHNIEDG